MRSAKLAAICNQTTEAIDAVVQRRLEGHTPAELRALAELWMAKPEEMLRHALHNWPTDCAAMVAVHFWRAYFRSIEAVAMEDGEPPTGELTDGTG